MAAIQVQVGGGMRQGGDNLLAGKFGAAFRFLLLPSSFPSLFEMNERRFTLTLQLSCCS